MIFINAFPAEMPKCITRKQLVFAGVKSGVLTSHQWLCTPYF